MPTGQQALTMLRANPTNFLRSYALLIQGDLPNGVYNCAISDFGQAVQRPGSVLRNLRTHTTQSFLVGPVQVLGNHGTNFNAHWLRMSQWQSANDIYNIQVMTLDHTGPDLMFTIMLTGCSIAITDRGGGNIDIAHIRPNSDMVGTRQDGMLDGEATHQVLRNAGWTTVYGRGNYGGDRRIAIVGVRRQNAWHVYAQKQEMNLLGPGNVRSVKTIF